MSKPSTPMTADHVPDSVRSRRSRMRYVTLLVIGLVLLLGCGRRGREDKVVMVADDDPKMNAAIDKARQTVDTFIQALKKPKRSQTAFSVKKAVTDGKQVEH